MAIAMMPVSIPREGVPKPSGGGFPSLPPFSGLFGKK
jgi:hypothetical protein